MAKTALYNMEGKAIGEVELSDEIFAAPINEAAMHLMVRSYLAAGRSTARRAPVTHGTMATAHRSSSTAAWCSPPSPVISTWP